MLCCAELYFAVCAMLCHALLCCAVLCCAVRRPWLCAPQPSSRTPGITLALPTLPGAFHTAGAFFPSPHCREFASRVGIKFFLPEDKFG